MIKGHQCKKCGAVALVDGRYVSEYCPKCKEG